MLKRIISVSCALTMLLCLFISPANAATGWQGYAVYRDGVGSAGVNIDWHTAIMDKAASTDVRPVVHAIGPGNNVTIDTWASFMGGNNTFMGYGRPRSTNMTSAQRDAVTATARQMAADFIGYTALLQLNYPDSNPNSKPYVQVSDILSARCDGVVEYCYEYNNIRVYGGDTKWDISKWNIVNRDWHSHVLITPKSQAQNYMSIVSTTP